jgi:DNA-binding PadR family transcriptional regulator
MLMLASCRVVARVCILGFRVLMNERTMAKFKDGLSLAEYAILGVLYERSQHGYEVARRFTADLDLGLVLPLDMSSVYALLKDLHEHRLLDGRRETVGLRPPRTVFQLTPEAELRWRQWLTEPVGRLREVRADLLVKLYFCRSIGSHLTVALLDAQLGASRAYRDRLVALAADAAPGSFERLVRDSKVGPAHATVTWLEQERTRLAG